MRILFYQLTATVVCSWLLLSSAAADTKPPAKIPIGVICALSGESSYGGQAHLTGIHLAVDDFNASHGNVQIELISRDDEGRPSKAKAEFDDLVNQQRVWAVMGSCNSGNTLAIAPMAEKQAVPL